MGRLTQEVNQTMNRRYGWRPDVPDHRDFTFAAPRGTKTPPKISLRGQMPPVYDQGQLGSCTANAIAAAHQFDQLIESGGAASFVPSRLFVYYNERAMEGTVDQDAGAIIRDGIKSIAKQGVCPESGWPYDVSKFTAKPIDACYAEALKHTAVEYLRVTRTQAQMERCLASGRPFVCGISVYESFESAAVAATGNVPMPGRKEQLLGGHAILVVGYDRSKKQWECRNSWGEGWGQKGYFTLPYPYLLNSNLSDDFWVVRTVQNAAA